MEGSQTLGPEWGRVPRVPEDTRAGRDSPVPTQTSSATPASLKTLLVLLPRVKGQWEPRTRQPTVGSEASPSPSQGPPGKPCPAEGGGAVQQGRSCAWGPAKGRCAGAGRVMRLLTGLSTPRKPLSSSKQQDRA